MTNKDENLIEAEIVYLGKAQLTGGSFGDRWITLEAFQSAEDVDALFSGSSLFQARKPAALPAGVYSANVKIEDGRLTSLGSTSFRRALDQDNELAAAIRLHAEGKADQERRLKAEAKLKREGAFPSCITELARIVGNLPITQQETAIAGITAAIRKEAIEQWRRSK